jgi:hypothetical protein
MRNTIGLVRFLSKKHVIIETGNTNADLAHSLDVITFLCKLVKLGVRGSVGIGVRRSESRGEESRVRAEGEECDSVRGEE